MNKNDQTKIRNLIQLMHRADVAYYNSKPIMSDGEFDNLYFQLKQYKQKYPQDQAILHYFATLPKNTDNSFKHVKHPYFIGSLDKTRTKTAVDSFLERWNQDPKSLWYTKTFLVERKEDGLSVVLYFNDPRMKKPFVALTRGGGHVGEEITNELYHFNRMDIDKIRHRVGNRHLVVRGEALISDKDFKRINKENNGKWANSRNLASGSIMNKDPRTVGKRGVFLSTYTLINRDEYIDQYPTELDQMKFLKSLGFYMIKNIHQFPNTKQGREDILNFMFNFPKSKRDAIGHPIDGMVIKPNYTVNNSKIGWNKHGPRYSVSWKFPPASALGILKGIRWQESANGRLTPVGILKQGVHLLGSTITKASLGTVGDMKHYHIMLNGYVRVRRMNDVIPKFFGLPQLNKDRGLTSPLTTLPGHAERHGKYYYLPKEYQSNQALILKWSKFTSKPCLNVMGLSDKVLAKMMQEHIIQPQNFASLFHADHEKWLATDGLGAKGWDNFQQQVKQAKSTPLARVLLGLPIQNAGLNALRPISKKIGDWHKIDSNKTAQAKMEKHLLGTIPKIKGLGNATVPIIKTLFSEPILKQLHNLSKYMTLRDNQTENHAKPQSQKLNGKHFVITGKLSHPRKYFIKQIKENGGKMQSSVNGKTDYLICNQKSNSSKYRNAVKKHVTIINEKHFDNLL